MILVSATDNHDTVILQYQYRSRHKIRIDSNILPIESISDSLYEYYMKIIFLVVMDIPHNDITEIGDTIEPDPKGLGVGINIIVSLYFFFVFLLLYFI